jgi:4-hydroxy-tetrahydrodipicolinate synthase
LQNKVKGKIPIIIGTGSNCTSSAVELTLQAKNLKADGALVVTPYYNKCEQEGLIAHYNKICNEAKFPIICYNVPKRTCTNINANSFSCILNNDYVFGIKEASDDINQIYEIINVAKNKVAVYCGNDSLNLEFLQLGASGFISVASNIIPLKIKDIFLNFANNYKCKAKDIHDNLKDFYFALFSKTNPIPVKAMAEILYDKKQNLRLPLTRANDNDFTYYKQILSNYFKL